MKQYAELWFTTKDVMKVLKISRTTVYRLIEDGKLTPKKVRNTNRFKLAEIKKILK